MTYDEDFEDFDVTPWRCSECGREYDADEEFVRTECGPVCERCAMIVIGGD